MIILGAGMAGCLAGVINPNATIYEPTDGSKRHNALLRFRTPEISKVTGIPFKKVRVIKSIWFEGKDASPQPRHIINYSKKVSGKINARSIQDISPCNRWIAPVDFHDRLIELCKERIEWNVDIPPILEKNDLKLSDSQHSIISTLPMHILAELIGWKIKADIEFSSIYVTTFAIQDCDVYMTIYYPDPDFAVYRASITGSQLIIESNGEIGSIEVEEVKKSFGLIGNNPKIELRLWNIEQKNGKIVPMEENERKRTIRDLTIKRQIYSLGRFATWRNILLDDILNDIYVIRQLITANHHYDSALQEISK